MTAEDLLNILDELGEDDFKRFKFFLKEERLKDSSTIPWSKLEKAERMDTVDLMIHKYKHHGAVEVTKKILKTINRNDLVQELPATSVCSSNPSHLRQLDLSYNHPGDSGVKLLSAGRDNLRVDHGGPDRLDFLGYARELKLDTNTVSRKLKLSDNNRMVTHVIGEEQSYPDHPERFDDWPQLLCRTGLTGRCYWEVEWRGPVSVSVSYRGISRRGGMKDCVFGGNDQSWSLRCCHVNGYSIRHNDKITSISSSFSSPDRVAVYVDCLAGSLSFYRVSSGRLIHINTFSTTFTEPLYPGFAVWPGSSVSLCPLQV